MRYVAFRLQRMSRYFQFHAAPSSECLDKKKAETLRSEISSTKLKADDARYCSRMLKHCHIFTVI